MKLDKFIELFINKNTLVRLWIKIPGGHKMVKDSTMEWELLKSTSTSKFEVMYITDIVTEYNEEAVNIVIRGDDND